MSKPGASGRKVDWSMTWRNWVRKAGKPPQQPTPPPDLLTRPKGGRTLQAIHKAFGEAWAAITADVLKSLADDIDVAAAGLEESDRAHFRSLVASEVQALSSPLAQAVAMGRERPNFPYEQIDWKRLAERTESQLHSTDGYEGRKNLVWWQKRYPERYGKPPAPAPITLRPAREIEIGGDRAATPTRPAHLDPPRLDGRPSPSTYNGFKNPNGAFYNPNR